MLLKQLLLKIRKDQYARAHMCTDSLQRARVHAKTHAHILQVHELMSLCLQASANSFELTHTHTGICETCLFMDIEAYMPTHVILQVNVVKCLCLQGFPGDSSD